ncbi:MAG: class I SAM-dependent methyltransferase [Candidatus Berkiella sp.]
MSSTEYYDKNTQEFYERTANHDMSESYNAFLLLLPNKANILDAGCGPGRDARYFMNRGHNVMAFDASIEMVNFCTKLTEQPALHLKLQDITFQNQFDGIWANASLLHVPFNELRSTFKKFNEALKSQGILYASFKYGNEIERKAEGRIFYDLNETKLIPYLDGFFDIIKIWREEDKFSWVVPSADNAWLRILAKKI